MAKGSNAYLHLLKKSKIHLVNSILLLFLCFYFFYSMAPRISQNASKAAQRRHKAWQQTMNEDWCRYAREEGVPQTLIDLRRLVCALPTTEFKYVTGMHSGDKGDKSQFGCAVLKVMSSLKRGRRPGTKDRAPRATKRSKAEKTSIKSASAGHRVVQPGDNVLDGPLVIPSACALPKVEVTYAESMGMSATELVDSIVSHNVGAPGSPLVSSTAVPLFHVPDTPDKAKVPTLTEMDVAWTIGALAQSPAVKFDSLGVGKPPVIGGLADDEETEDEDDDKGMGMFDYSQSEYWSNEV